MPFTSIEMIPFKITAFTLMFIVNQCFSTIVKDDYSSATGTLINANNEVININANAESEKEDWHMRNFPDKKEEENKNWNMPYFPDEFHHHRFMFSDRNDSFIVDPECDDAKEHIGLDLQDLVSNTVCFTKPLEHDGSIPPILHSNLIPKAYEPPHICTGMPIEYADRMVSFGAYRPLWAKHGEYDFIPKQRWLHNLEHGTIVMLYHPCAHPLIVNQLRKLVTNCLWRHIITPYVYLSEERPLALYAWGKYLTMSIVDFDTVTNFIKENALKGPENIARNGKYDHLLVREAEPVSYPSDAVICPHFPRD